MLGLVGCIVWHQLGWIASLSIGRRAYGAGLGTSGLSRWDSGEGLGGASDHRGTLLTLSMFPQYRDICPIFLLPSFLPFGRLIVWGAQGFWAMGLTLGVFFGTISFPFSYSR